jgi:hypothetical protein
VAVLTEVSTWKKNLSQYHLVYHKSHMTLTGLELGHRSAKTTTNRLNFGKAKPLTASLKAPQPAVEAYRVVRC